MTIIRIGGALCIAMLFFGCDSAQDPLVALATLRVPNTGDTLHVGQPFELSATFETDGPADSVVATVVYDDRLPVYRFNLDIPEPLRTGDGVLKAQLDTVLVFEKLPVPAVHNYDFILRAYARNGNPGAGSLARVVVE